MKNKMALLFLVASISIAPTPILTMDNKQFVENYLKKEPKNNTCTECGKNHNMCPNDCIFCKKICPECKNRQQKIEENLINTLNAWSYAAKVGTYATMAFTAISAATLIFMSFEMRNSRREKK